MGLLVTILTVCGVARKKKGKKEDGNYGVTGMSLGMCFGVLIGTAFGDSIGLGIGISIGALVGLVIGECVFRESRRIQENETKYCDRELPVRRRAGTKIRGNPTN